MCPTTALRAQWADAADLVGLHLDPRWRNADGAWRADVDGVVVTYQQVASAPDLFAHHLARPTFVVLDEIHHAGESATWGTALRAAFDGARRRLALSGTPFRSDARAIPFVRYDDERRCAPDFVYGYGEAVADGVCRPLAFRLLDATLRWRVDAQETIAAFADELDPTDDARRLRTAIDPATPLLPQMLRDADALLRQGARRDPRRRRPRPVRRPRARARDRRAAADDRRREAGRRRQRRAAGAHARIDRFARGDADAPRWLVAVNMVSEGVDVPRLVLAAYATVKRTDLFFRQAVGRVVRRRAEDPDDLVATVFLPADPTLTGCAERVEVELRQQVSDEVGAAFEVEPPPGLARRADFQPLDAAGRARRDDRRRRPLRAARRSTPRGGCCASSASPSARCARCSSSSAASASAARRRAARRPAVPAHRRVEAKRRALDRLARRWAQLRREIDPGYTWPQAQARVNRAMGVAPPRRGRRARSSTTASLPALRAREARPRLPRTGRAPAHPGERRSDRRASGGVDERRRRRGVGLRLMAAGRGARPSERGLVTSTASATSYRTVLDDKLLEDVRACGRGGMSPKEIARTLGLRPAVVAPIVRRVAQEESAEQPARGRVVGCWVSPAGAAD